MLCSICKENMAVVFVTKIINGKQTQEGLCLSCAKKLGIQPITRIIEQSGMSDEDIDGISKQIGGLFENAGQFQFADSTNGQLGEGNPFFNFLNGIFARSGESAEAFSGEKQRASEDKNDRNVKTKVHEKKIPRRKKYLDIYGINLIERAREGKIDRIVGRQREIDRVIQILNRRTKNNPVLIGEAGVGKTAIAEGLALKIAEGQVPAKLLNVEIYQLDMTGIVAGTQFRGQFEGRMKGIIEEAKTFGNVILVIDELHNIIGAGEAEGAMNAANILKPALTHGDIQIIGATTLNEYRKHIEKDSALERRFQPVVVDEPGIDETIEILKGIKNYYEDYHRVKISDEVIRAAVVLSGEVYYRQVSAR